MSKVTIHVEFVPSKFWDVWLAHHEQLVEELTKLMPDVMRYTSTGFKQYKHYRIENIIRCYNSDTPGAVDGCNVIELEVIPNNI